MLKQFLLMAPFLMSGLTEAGGNGGGGPPDNDGALDDGDLSGLGELALTGETDDPLGFGFDSNEVETARPLVAPGKYPGKVKEFSIEPNSKQTGRNLVVRFEFTQDVPSCKIVDGKVGPKSITNDLKAGFTVTKWYPMQQSDNEKAPDYKEDLVRLQDAALHTKKGSRPRYNPSEFVGKDVLIGVSIQKPKDEVSPPGNNVAIYEVKPETVQAAA